MNKPRIQRTCLGVLDLPRILVTTMHPVVFVLTYSTRFPSLFGIRSIGMPAVMMMARSLSGGSGGLLRPCAVGCPGPCALLLLLPAFLRRLLGYFSVTIFCQLFWVIPFISITMLSFLYRAYSLGKLGATTATIAVVWFSLAFMPYKRWPWWSRVFRLWYEPFHVKTYLHTVNQTPPDPALKRSIMAMHPHRVIPLHSIIMSAIIEQHFPHMYGFAVAADVLLRLPLMRQVIGWLNTYGSTKQSLDKHLETKNMFITLDGIRGIFLAKPGREVAVINQRMGFFRLAMKHRARVVPVYVFGANEMWHNLTADENGLLGSLCRRLRMSIFCLFYGSFPWILPVPRFVPLTYAFGEDVDAAVLREQAMRENPDASASEVDEAGACLLRDAYRASLISAFEKNKHEAGYADRTLEIL